MLFSKIITNIVKYVYKSNNEYIIKRDGRYLSACSNSLCYTTHNYNNILLDELQGALNNGSTLLDIIKGK